MTTPKHATVARSELPVVLEPALITCRVVSLGSKKITGRDSPGSNVT